MVQVAPGASETPHVFPVILNDDSVAPATAAWIACEVLKVFLMVTFCTPDAGQVKLAGETVGTGTLERRAMP
jgi:hypothetical protein